MSPQDDAQQLDQGQPGSGAANQGKTEPMPPTSGHADPDAAPEPATVEVPELEGMNVGSADPQSPSHPAAGGHADRGASGVPPLDTPVLGGATPDAVRSEPDSTAATGRDVGPELPLSTTDGRAQRAPGSDGLPPASEQIETDVERSAQNTSLTGTPGTDAGPGDAADVPVPSELPAPGTAEQSAVAQGSRTPE